MTEIDVGAEFLAVRQQITKNAEVLRRQRRLELLGSSVDNSEIICELYPTTREQKELKFGITAYQHSDRFLDPRPQLSLKRDVSSSERESLLSNVQVDQLVISAIKSHRAAVNKSQHDSAALRQRIADARQSPDGVGTFKDNVGRHMDECLALYPDGTNPTEEQLDEVGVSLQTYQRLLTEKDDVILEIARDILEYDAREVVAQEQRDDQQLVWLREMEAKVLQGQYTYEVDANSIFLNITVKF